MARDERAGGGITLLSPPTSSAEPYPRGNCLASPGRRSQALSSASSVCSSGSRRRRQRPTRQVTQPKPGARAEQQRAVGGGANARDAVPGDPSDQRQPSKRAKTRATVKYYDSTPSPSPSRNASLYLVPFAALHRPMVVSKARTVYSTTLSPRRGNEELQRGSGGDGDGSAPDVRPAGMLHATLTSLTQSRHLPLSLRRKGQRGSYVATSHFSPRQRNARARFRPGTHTCVPISPPFRAVISPCLPCLPLPPHSHHTAGGAGKEKACM